MTARKRTKKPIKWWWLDVVHALLEGDESLTAARRATTMLVALGRAEHADPDGRNCYPSQSTLAAFAFTTRDTVRESDEWLVERGVMVLTKKAGRGSSRRYRLVLPASEDDRDAGHSSNEKMTVTPVIQAEEDDRQDDRHGDRGDGHNSVLRSETKEEEEARNARFADAALAARSSCPTDLFSDGVVERPTRSYREVVQTITAKVGRTVDETKLGPALAFVQAEVGWDDETLAAYCVSKLKERPRKIADPTAYLVTDLTTRVTETTTLTVEMQFAAQIAVLRSLGVRIAEWQAAFRAVNSTGFTLGEYDPFSMLWWRLTADGLVDEDDVSFYEDVDALPDVWDIKPAHREQWVQHLVAVNEQSAPVIADQLPEWMRAQHGIAPPDTTNGA